MHTTTLLLLEDHPGDARLIRELLRDVPGRSVVILHAASLKDARTTLLDTRVNVALVDLSLPDSHGLATFRHLAEAHPSLPQILLTGLDDRETAIHAVREGAQDYLIKGEVDGRILIRAIDYAIERKRIQSELEAMNDRIRQSADDLHSILNQLHIGTILIDPHGCILHANAAALRFLGTREPHPEGQRWQDVVGLPAHDVHALEQLMGHAADERKTLSVRFITPTRSQRWLDIDVRDDPRDVRAKTFFLYDVTELHTLRKQLDEQSHFYDLIGKCPLMQDVYRRIHTLAPVDSTVLIEGETGTGKELVARALHAASPRKAHPFLAVNCAGLTESLLGSQLFGHKKGAFTGAGSDHRGFFEFAHGGTIFLDEIGDMPPSVQTSLLRVLQEKEITRLGESQPRKVDIRILCATHQDLNAQVAQGIFRADLLYRIRVGRIRLPALRERTEDIPSLVATFLSQCRHAMGKLFVQDVSPEGLHLLSLYAWPGNVRELKSVIEYVVLQCAGSTIRPHHFPPELLDHTRESFQPDTHAARAAGDKDKDRILAALQRSKGHRTQAARLLGISRATLYRWMDDLGITL